MKACHDPEVVAAADRVLDIMLGTSGSKRRPGRPPGSKNKSRALLHLDELELIAASRKASSDVSKQPEGTNEKVPVSKVEVVMPVEEIAVPVVPAKAGKSVDPVIVQCRSCPTHAPVEKAMEHFTRDKYSPTGFRHQCKTCARLKVVGSSAVTIAFDKLPEGMDLLEHLKNDARKNLRAVGDHILILLSELYHG